MVRPPVAVYTLVALNAVVFLASALVQGLDTRLLERGAFWYPENPHFAPSQALTYMFLHASFSHAFFNLFALASFGSQLERVWGSARFVLFYLLCGVGAGLIQIGINHYEFGQLHRQLVDAGFPTAALGEILATGQGAVPADAELRAAIEELYRIYAAPMLGASGAVYGVLVAFGVMYPNARLALLFLPVPVAAKVFIPILLALDLLSGLTGFSILGAGVAHFAHLGGAAIGFVLMLLWRRRQAPPAVGTPA